MGWSTRPETRKLGNSVRETAHYEVAIKKFKESDDDDIVRKTTMREVKILRMMRHDCIVMLREAFKR